MHTAVYIPACLALSSTIPLLSERIFVLLVLVCNPAVLIIDHGHFQYNGIGLGLTVCCIIIVRLLLTRFLKSKVPKCADWRNFLHCYKEISHGISIILLCTQPQTDDSVFCSSCICPFIRNVLEGKEDIGEGRLRNHSPCMRKKPSSYLVEFHAGHNACTAGCSCGGIVHHLLDTIHRVDGDDSTSYKENISSPKRVVRRLCSKFLVCLVWRTASNN